MNLQLNSEMLFILASSAGIVCALVAYFQWRRAERAHRCIGQLEIEMAALSHFSKQVEELKDALAEETERRIEADTRVSLMRQRVDDMDQRAKDVEEFKRAAQASVLEAGQKLSSKLLEDHKREAQRAKEESEKLTQKTSKELMGQFEQLAKLVATIQHGQEKTSKDFDTVMRALTNPGGAGKQAEILLENSLNALGLIPEQDFIMQHHIATDDGPNLRPDAVIFLPQDMVMVIDSKASKFIFELAEVEGTPEEEAVLKSLLLSMHQHIDALARKQYAEAVAKALKNKGRRVGRMLNVMYLPSDASIEKIRSADRTLAAKCERADIVLAGPASLAGLFSLARQQISAAKQDENQQKIIQIVRELMDNVVTALGYAEKVGGGIKQSAENYQKFTSSLNGRLLPKLRSLQQLGVEPSKSKAIPPKITSYEVHASTQTITGEASELEPALSLTDKQSA